MTEYHRVASCDDVPLRGMRAFLVEGRKIVVYHTERGWYASDNSCPHRGGPLVEGDLLGNEIVCPWHLWGFDVATGCNDRFPEVAVTVHDVKVEDGAILVRLNERKSGE